MNEPITVSDIGDFLQITVTAFQSPLFLAFVIMITFAVALGIKRMVVDQS